MKTLRFTRFLIISSLILVAASPLIAARVQAQPLPTKLAVEAAMRQVNDYWISQHPDPGDNMWARAVYFTGDMAHYMTTGEEKYLDYAIDWAERHNWQLIGGCYTSHADNQAAGQTYLALNDLDPDPAKIACVTNSIGGMIARFLNNEALDDWSWIDALYMAMPVFAKLAADRNNSDYSETMYELYRNTKYTRGLYNADKGLWYRDENFRPELQYGKDIFWSRGNGWVFAAHARVLAVLPNSDPHYNEYLTTFQAMAAALKTVQRSDGFWNVNLADANDHPGPETSGTAFFTYGLAMGMAMGLLSPAEYLQTVVRAWNGMIETAVHPDGKLGFVQGVGYAPFSSQPVTYDSTSDFGVGAFLLAGSAVSAAVEDYEPHNLAWHHPATCSSEPEPDNGCTHTVDGNLDNRWSADGFPQWVEVDLGAVGNINGINVHPYKDRAYRYAVEVRTAADDPYVQVVDRSDNTQGGSIITDAFSPVLARYVRLRVDGAYNYSGAWVSIREFEILGY